MALFNEKVLISNRCISGLMPNLIKKSWTVSIMDPITEMGVAQSRVNFCKKYNFKSLELYFMQIKTFAQLHNTIHQTKFK